MYISSLEIHISRLEMKFIPCIGNFSCGFRSFSDGLKHPFRHAFSKMERSYPS